MDILKFGQMAGTTIANVYEGTEILKDFVFTAIFCLVMPCFVILCYDCLVQGDFAKYKNILKRRFSIMKNAVLKALTWCKEHLSKAEAFAFAFACALVCALPSFAFAGEGDGTAASTPNWSSIVNSITNDLSSMIGSVLPGLFGVFAIFLGVRIVRVLIRKFTRV